MRKTQKILTLSLWTLTIVALVSLIGAGVLKRQRQRELEVYGQAPAFSLLDQDGKPVTDQTLRGQAYIADFVFTRCAGPCPMMTARMAGLHKELLDPKVRFVSISVDPEHDTPAVLKEYAKKFNADEARWRFLTGEKEAVFALARGMLVTAMPAQDQQPIMHSEKFLLVDGEGRIRKAYDSRDEQEMRALVKDAGRLTE